MIKKTLLMLVFGATILAGCGADNTKVTSVSTEYYETVNECKDSEEEVINHIYTKSENMLRNLPYSLDSDYPVIPLQ